MDPKHSADLRLPLGARVGGDDTDALVIGDTRFSRGELYAAATAAAERVAGAGKAAVYARPAAETVLAVLGGLIAGVTIVPVPPDAGRSEIAHILTDSGAQAWLGPAPEDVGSLPRLPKVPVRLHARSWHAHPRPDPESAALIIYTSGTTGAPKGVVLSHRAIAADLDGLAEAWQWTARDVLVHGLPLFHVHGLVLGILGPLRRGGRVIHTVRPTPENYAAHRGTMYFGVPTVWGRVAADEDSARALRQARMLVSGSAPLPVPVFERLRELTGLTPIERYGMSETLITLSTRADGERRPGWVGVPIAGVETRLRGEDGDQVPHDGESIGGLQVRGETLFGGYLNKPDATAAEFTDDGWFATGDVACIDPGGFHRIVGRASTDLISSGGYRVGAGEVETALLAHRDVAEAAVIGVPDDDLGQRIVAWVVPPDSAAAERLCADSGAALIDAAASALSAHKRPREVRVVDGLPRNAMGKIQKKQLTR